MAERALSTHRFVFQTNTDARRRLSLHVTRRDRQRACNKGTGTTPSDISGPVPSTAEAWAGRARRHEGHDRDIAGGGAHPGLPIARHADAGWHAACLWPPIAAADASRRRRRPAKPACARRHRHAALDPRRAWAPRVAGPASGAPCPIVASLRGHASRIARNGNAAAAALQAQRPRPERNAPGRRRSAAGRIPGLPASMQAAQSRRAGKKAAGPVKPAGIQPQMFFGLMDFPLSS